jgi:hypothetical protein
MRCRSVAGILDCVTPDRLEDHQADHTAIQAAFEEWDFDPEARDDILRDTLILHLGGLHGWTVAENGSVLGLAPMLAKHDREHRAHDVLGVESCLDPRIIEAVRVEALDLP